MPKVTVGDTTPVLLYRSQHGTVNNATSVTFRIDPSADADARISYAMRSDVTDDTADGTDGVPLLADEVATENIHSQTPLYAIAASGTSVDVFVEPFGSA